MPRPSHWQTAIDLRAREAEDRFLNEEPVDADDMVAMALAHPEKFEISIRNKEDPNA